MKIIILAAGSEERFGGTIKQLVPVRDGTPLSRTMKMLEGYDCTIMTHREEIIKLYPEICVVPIKRSATLDTIVSSRYLWDETSISGEVCFLLADVIYTKKALDRILKPIDKSHQFYGNLEEPFGFRFNEIMYKRVIASCYFLLLQDIEGTIWELYRCLTGIPIDKDWRDSWFFTFIGDKTDDIDYLDDYRAKISSGYFEDSEFDL